MTYTGNSSNVCVLFGYGQKEFGEQMAQRADKALALYKKGTVKDVYVTGVLGNKIYDHLSHHIDPQYLHVDPRGLTTAGEILLFNTHLPNNALIYSVSSWYHLPRIWLIWRSYSRTVRLIPSWKGTTITDVVREIALLFFSVVRPRAFTWIEK